MQKYCLTVLVNEKVSEADRNSSFEAIKKNFSNLIKEDLWGVRSLAYEIKHANKAFYAYFEFEAEPEAVITLDKNIRLNEDIIRYLIIRIDQKRIKKAKIKKTEPEPVKDKEEVSKEEKSEVIVKEKGTAKKK